MLYRIQLLLNADLRLVTTGWHCFAVHELSMSYWMHSCSKGFAGVQVRMLIGLIRKVTGVTISAFFKQKGGYKYSGHKMEMPWHSNSGFGHKIRKYRMR